MNRRKLVNQSIAYIFEKAFACEADVELLKSIKMGDPICLMQITLHNPVWQ